MILKKLNKINLIIFFLFLSISFANANFKEIKNNPVVPVIKVDAPSGYGLDNRFNFALNKFENFKRPCGGGNIEACENVKRVILDWAKADAAQRKGPSDHEAKHWNDTLTVNLWIASDSFFIPV